MKRKSLFALWGGLFVVCAALGFVPQAKGLLAWLLAALGLLFFVPPMMLLYRARENGHRSTAVLVGNIAAISLILTLLALVANVLSLMGSVALGNALNVVLAIVSTPMFCGQFWALTLFCWAFLMIAAKKLAKQMKTQA